MNVYDFTVLANDGAERSLRDYAGKVLLIVNTASRCGLTPQYSELQELYDRYRERGLEILAFPCNQFAEQEPGTDEEILDFCRTNYGVTFPLFAKIDVNGDGAHPLYVYLKEQAAGPEPDQRDIPWNFTKFLVDRRGTVVRRVEPRDGAAALEPEIRALL